MGLAVLEERNMSVAEEEHSTLEEPEDRKKKQRKPPLGPSGWQDGSSKELPGHCWNRANPDENAVGSNSTSAFQSMHSWSGRLEKIVAGQALVPASRSETVASGEAVALEQLVRTVVEQFELVRTVVEQLEKVPLSKPACRMK